jgi:tRNA (adenine22-N1)-methyltransferase
MEQHFSKRIETIINWISPNEYLADVGCDHGQVCYGVLRNGMKKVQAIDNKKEPLSKAVKLLTESGFQNQFVATLSSGLEQIEPWVTIATICGMGGELIESLLSTSKDKLSSLHYLILEANTKAKELRSSLFSFGLIIVDEKIICDAGVYYELMKVAPTRSPLKYSGKECFFGPILIKEKNVDFKNKWTIRLTKINELIQQHPNLQTKFEQEIQWIKEAIA